MLEANSIRARLGRRELLILILGSRSENKYLSALDHLVTVPGSTITPSLDCDFIVLSPVGIEGK